MKRRKAALSRARAKAAFNEATFLDTNDNPITNNWHHNEWFELMEFHKYLLLPAAREHAKTEIGVKTNALFEMGVDHNIRILIVSDIHEKAKDRTRLLREHIEGNEEYQREFPGVKIVKKDGDHTFTVQRDRILKEPTVTSTYAGGAISGGRFDRIICDDLVNLIKNSYTAEQRAKLRSWFYRDVMNSLAAGGKLLMLGTPQHHEDLHVSVAQDNRFHVVSYPGVDEEDTGYGSLGFREKNERRGITGDDAACLWPAMHDYESHMARKEGDYDTFLSQQQLQAVPSTGLVYRRPLVEAAIQKGKSVGYDPSAAQFVGLDPGYAKRAAMLAIQERAGDRIDLWKEHSFTQMDDSEVTDVVAEHCLKYRVQTVYCDAEDPGLIATLKRKLQEKGARSKVVGVPFGKYKRLGIKATRWLLGQEDRVAWKAEETIEHVPGRSGERARVVPSIFGAEVKDYALKEGEDDEPAKDQDHGPDAWTAYASKWIRPWLKATGQKISEVEEPGAAGETLRVGGLTRVR